MKFSTLLKTASAAVALMTLAAMTSNAAMASPSACDAVSGNLIVNCGFESGSLSGWTSSGNSGFTGVATGGSYAPHSGDYYAYQGAVGSENFLSQTFSDTAGAQYTISLWMISNGATPNAYDVEWNGTALFDQSDVANTQGWTNLTFSVMGTGSDTLAISSRDDPDYLGTDDVVVAAATAGVPEPASLALIGLGLLGLGASRRRSA